MARLADWNRAMVLALAVTLLLAPAPLLFAQNKAKAAAPAPKPSAPPVKAMGSKGAPITIEVFSDFQCPACRRLYEESLRPLMDDYVAAGKVYLVHRDFPLEGNHKYARQAARYANAAARVGKFEKVVEAIYARQDFWSLDGNLDAAVAAVLTPAEMKKVRLWVQQPEQLDAAINQDMQLGQRIPVRQTPTMVVMHRGATYPLPPGGVNYPLLRQFLDQLLRQ